MLWRQGTPTCIPSLRGAAHTRQRPFLGDQSANICRGGEERVRERSEAMKWKRGGGGGGELTWPWKQWRYRAFSHSITQCSDQQKFCQCRFQS
jgi:hypothetical protein